MAVATYTSDLTDIFLFESTTGVSATGGGGAGLAIGVDFAMEGTYAVDKKVGANFGEVKGFMYDNTSNFTIGADDHFYIWGVVATPGISDLRVIIGDDTSNFRRFLVGFRDFYIVGNDTDLDLKGQPYAIRYSASGAQPGGGSAVSVGSPSTTPSWIGVQSATLTSVKSPNLAGDGARIGTGYDILNGTGADPEANFAGIESDDSSTSEGIFIATDGGYRQNGKLRIGSASTACEFLDSNTFIGTYTGGQELDTHNEILIEHASSIVTLDNVTFRCIAADSRNLDDLPEWNRGRFEVLTDTATVNLTGCTFQIYGDIILGSGTTAANCNFINTYAVTANGADLSGSNFLQFQDPAVADDSHLIWDTADDPDGLLDGCSFTKGVVATHAIEFGTSSPTVMTLTDVDFSGYNASNGQNDSTLHFLRTTGTITVNIVGGSGTVSYKTAGATINIVQNPVTLQLHVIDQSDGTDVQGARAHIEADSTGPLPFEDSVTITRVTTTASVAHTAHGLANGEKVLIAGADQDEYNGVKTISNVSTNAYDFTVSGSPTTPATGTIISTAVIISGTTDSGGLISDTRPYTSDQQYTGRVRKSSITPFYKTSPLNGTIDKDNGATVTVQMILDE